MLRLALIPAAAAILWSQHGTLPKEKPADYPVHAAAPGGLTIAADYLVHSLPGHKATYVVPDYLVIEVACYPEKGRTAMIAASRFSLKINGKKSAIFAQVPGIVAASVKYENWDHPRGWESTVGTGDREIVINRPRPTERFPTDNRTARERLPRPPRAPADDNPAGLDREENMTVDELVVDAALPEGPASGPVSGFLYFPHKGKTKSIKSLELIYTDGDKSASLRIY